MNLIAKKIRPIVLSKRSWNGDGVRLSAISVFLPTCPCSAGWRWCASTCWEPSGGWSPASSTPAPDGSLPTQSLGGDFHSSGPVSLSLPQSSLRRSPYTIHWLVTTCASSTKTQGVNWSSSTSRCASSSSSTWSASSSAWSTWEPIEVANSARAGKGQKPFWRRSPWTGIQGHRW